MDDRSRRTTDGLLPAAYPLADPGVVDRLRRDLPLHRMEIDRYRTEGTHRVPYVLTDASSGPPGTRRSWPGSPPSSTPTT